MIYTETDRTTALTTAGELNNPFVAWDNLMVGATLGGAPTLTGGEGANAVTGSTYDKWRPDITTTSCNLDVDLGVATVVSFAAIAAHNVFTLGATFVMQNSSDGISYSNAGITAVTPTDDKPIAFRLSTTATAYRYWRFRFTGLTAGDLLSVGVAFLGNDLIIPRRLYQGFAPVLTPTEVQLQSNVSVGGHLLGSSVISRGATLAADISNIEPSFIRGASWLDFQASFGEGKGFFFAWRPTKYPEDIHYCAREGGVIRPENTGPRDLMNIKFSARVYANG